MLSGRYGISDDLSLMAMFPFIRKEMDHITRTGVKFTTQSDGIGDLKAMLNYRVFQSDNHMLQLGAGLSFHTGSIDEEDDTPAGPNQPLPYPMQLGSGTFDLLPAITYTGQIDDYAWGAQFRVAIRLGENDRDYTLGNYYQLSAWGSRKWNDWLSTSLRLQGEIEENIDGADPRLNPRMVATTDPNLRAGERINLGLGFNIQPSSGWFADATIGLEALVPIYQDLDGPQLERDYTLMFGLRKSF